MKRPAKKEINPLSPKEARTFLDAAHGDDLEALHVLAVSTDMCQGELLGLKWEDVDLEVGTLQVRRALSQTKDGPALTPPKSAQLPPDQAHGRGRLQAPPASPS